VKSLTFRRWWTQEAASRLGRTNRARLLNTTGEESRDGCSGSHLDCARHQQRRPQAPIHSGGIHHESACLRTTAEHGNRTRLLGNVTQESFGRRISTELAQHTPTPLCPGYSYRCGVRNPERTSVIPFVIPCKSQASGQSKHQTGASHPGESTNSAEKVK